MKFVPSWVLFSGPLRAMAVVFHHSRWTGVTESLSRCMDDPESCAARVDLMRETEARSASHDCGQALMG